MILIFGGDRDPNIVCFVNALLQANANFYWVKLMQKQVPLIALDNENGYLYINNQHIKPTAFFGRDDVFKSTQTGVSPAFYEILKSYCLLNEIPMFNADYIGFHKVRNLLLAKRFGLPTPMTIMTNELASLKQLDKDFAIKPINGGAYTNLLSRVSDRKLQSNVTPYFAQTLLVAPEIRIFVVGNQLHAFEIRSSSLDYRTDSCTEIIPTCVPDHLVEPMLQLCQYLHLDFAAADFKTHPFTGELMFLEVNSGPMFARFDFASNGALTAEMIRWLDRGGE